MNESTQSKILAELMCRREAAITDKTQLPDRFWMNHPWKKKYALQCIAANRLLKIYDYEVIMVVLNKRSGTYSLNAGWIKDDLVAEQIKWEQRQVAIQETPKITPVTGENRRKEKFYGKEE